MSDPQAHFWTPASVDFALCEYWQGGYYQSPFFYPYPKRVNFDTYFWFINGEDRA